MQNTPTYHINEFLREYTTSDYTLHVCTSYGETYSVTAEIRDNGKVLLTSGPQIDLKQALWSLNTQCETHMNMLNRFVTPKEVKHNLANL